MYVCVQVFDSEVLKVKIKPLDTSILLFLFLKELEFMCCCDHVRQEDGVDLVTIIKGASYYRRGKSLDYISDFMPPTATEFNELNEENR